MCDLIHLKKIYCVAPNNWFVNNHLICLDAFTFYLFPFTTTQTMGIYILSQDNALCTTDINQ